MPNYVMAVDAGTTGCKVILFDLHGRAIIRSYREYPILYPQPTWAEQNPDFWWNATVDCIREVVKKSGVDKRDIEGVGVDSQREAVVPIDNRGRKLAYSIIWLDRRTMPQAEDIKRRLTWDEVLATTGLPIDYFYSAAKILWYRENMPRKYERTFKLLFPKDYIIYKLTGELVTDHSMASRTMLFDITRLKWSERICEGLDISLDKLPQVKASWDPVGEISGKAAQLLGLRKGMIVAGGGGDRPCEALGAGVVSPGSINIGTGTGTVLTTPLSKPFIEKSGRVDCCCHVVPGKWELEFLILTTGASLRWFRDNFGFEEVFKGEESNIDPYEILIDKARKIPIGSENLFYYPYPMGGKSPIFNDMAKGVFFGFTLGHTKPHFVRAILEGIAFQYAGTIELLKSFGIEVKKASIVGGESRSRFWNQMKADITGIPIYSVEEADAAALGSGILAALASNAFNNYEKAVDKMVKVKEVYKPGKDRSAKYIKLLNKYKQIFRKIEEAYPTII